MGCSLWVLPVWTAVFTSLVAEVGGEVQYELLSYYPSTATNGILTSPDWPSSDALHDIYVYNISILSVTSYSTPLYVQITSSDFDLGENGVFKIYDGPSYHNKSYVYGPGDWPVFQSVSGTVLLVYKPRGMSAKYRGFQLNYTFVDYDRSWWRHNDMPSTGYCPKLEGDSASVEIRGRTSLGYVYNLDCAYNIWATSDLVILQLSNVTFVPGVSNHRSVEVRLSSGAVAMEINSSSLSQFSFPTPNLYSTVWYLRILGKLDPSDSVRFIFADAEYKMDYQQFTPNLAMHSCPYKEWAIYNCGDYWDTYVYSDASCNYYLEKFESEESMCNFSGTTTQCFDPDHDTCDEFTDCGNAEDEEEGCDGSFSFYSLIGIFAMLLLFVCARDNFSLFKCVTSSILDCPAATCRRLERCCLRCQDGCTECCKCPFSVHTTADAATQDGGASASRRNDAYEVDSVSSHVSRPGSSAPSRSTSVGFDSIVPSDYDPCAPPPSYDELNPLPPSESHVSVPPEVPSAPTAPPPPAAEEPPPSYEEWVSREERNQQPVLEPPEYDSVV